jgi:hypothetical protein
VKPLLLALLLALPVAPHDFFISILTIRHTSNTRTLDLTWRITAHDVEHALINVAELKLASPKEHPKADSLLNAYFHEHLHIAVNGQPVDWTWVGKELESETLYCYLQVQGVDCLSSLTVSNTLLQDLFYEQQNMVHLEEVGKPVRSHSFVRGSGSYSLIE